MKIAPTADLRVTAAAPRHSPPVDRFAANLSWVGMGQIDKVDPSSAALSFVSLCSPYRPSREPVSASSTPVTAKPSISWKSRSARSVAGPKTPSTLPTL